MRLLQKKRYIIAGLLPALLLYAMVVIYPIASSFYYGFFEWNGLSRPVFIGIENFRNILQDGVFWLSFRNNMLVVVASILGQVPVALVLAVILSSKLRGVRFFRSAFFMPMVLSTVVVGLLWSVLLNYNSGVVNRILTAAGLEKLAQNWLGNPSIAIYAICVVILWQFAGFYMIIFLAAIQNISTEVLEAADIDGANPAQKLLFVTLPMLWPTVMTVVVLCISGSMRSFDIVYVMTQGGPAHATELMATYMYNKTFNVYKYGYGSAVSLLIFVISFSLIAVSRMLMERKGLGGGEQ
jgi:raffinose/stachyose/melibiose transport system permease protein